MFFTFQVNHAAMSAHILHPHPSSFNFMDDVKPKTAGKALTEVFNELSHHTEPEIIPVFMKYKQNDKAATL